MEQRGAAQQRGHSRAVSIDVDATQRARERSGSEASTSGRPTGGGDHGADPWLPAVRTRLSGLGLQDGSSGSMPLEAASPLRGSRASGGCSLDGGVPAAADAAGHAAPAVPQEYQHPPPQRQQQQQQQRREQHREVLTADDHHGRGYALRKHGDFAGAVAEYSAGLALDPKHFRCRFNRAFSLDKVGGSEGWGVGGGTWEEGGCRHTAATAASWCLGVRRSQ